MLQRSTDHGRLAVQSGRHYDRMRRILPYIERLLSEDNARAAAIRHFGSIPGGVLLDVGSNVGQNTGHLRDIVGPTGLVAGIDPALQCVSEARLAASEKGWTNVEYAYGDVRDIYETGRIFDGVFLGYCIAVIPDIESVVRGLLQHLKPGSMIIICDAEIPGIMHFVTYWRFAAWVARTVFKASNWVVARKLMLKFAHRGQVHEVAYERLGVNVISVWRKI